MTQGKNTLSTIAYFILGLVVLIAVVRVIGWLLNVLSQLIALALSIALVIVVGYVVWALIKAAIKSAQE